MSRSAREAAESQGGPACRALMAACTGLEAAARSADGDPGAGSARPPLRRRRAGSGRPARPVRAGTFQAGGRQRAVRAQRRAGLTPGRRAWAAARRGGRGGTHPLPSPSPHPLPSPLPLTLPPLSRLKPESLSFSWFYPLGY